MAKIHIISDLFLGYNEFATEEEELPDVDLIILNGNIGNIKRSMFYAESLSKKYPYTQIVVNLGFAEKYLDNLCKFAEETIEGIVVRQKFNSSWPKNLHCSLDPMHIQLRTGEIFSVLCTFGFPYIHKVYGEWTDFWYSRNIVSDVTLSYDHPNMVKPKNTSNVSHGHFPIWASKEWVNENHEKETNKVKQWELTPDHRKILVTHINPFKDDRNKDLVVSPYEIHLNEGLWVTSNTKVEHVKFLGARLVSNPGRGKLPRSHIVVI